MNVIEMINTNRRKVLGILNNIYDSSVSNIIIENIISEKKYLNEEIKMIEDNFNKTKDDTTEIKKVISLLGNNLSSDFIYIIKDGKLITIAKDEVDRYGLSKIRKL